MKKIFLLFILMAILTFSSCSDSNEDGDDEYIPILSVSIIQLIANPAEYHGKTIRVDGVVELGKSVNAVSLSKDCWYNMVSKNALYLDFDMEFIGDENLYFEEGAHYNIVNELIPYEEAREKYNGKYVLIEGVFDMNYRGMRQQHVGGIINITRFSLSTINRDTNIEDYYVELENICGCYDDN